MRAGVVTTLCASLLAGRVWKALAYPSWYFFCIAKFRNLEHSGGAAFEQEKPSRPPIMAPAVPAPPLMVGKGNHPRSASGFLSGVRDAITPGSHAPMSSMAAWWLASRPADEPAPCWAVVVRKPLLKGLALENAARSSPAFVQHLSSNFLSAVALFRVSCEQARSAKK